MEFEDYIKGIKKYIYLPIGLALIIGGFSLYSSLKTPYNFSGAVTFTIGNSNEVISGANNFNNYYSVSASSIVADTIGGWLTSPNYIALIHQKAGVGLTAKKVSSVKKLLNNNKSSLNSSVVVAELVGKTNQEINNLLSSTQAIIQQEFKKQQDINAISKDIKLSVSDPIVITSKKNLTLDTLIGMIAGLILGSALAIIFQSTKK